jgi:hypothetical protein
MSVWATSATVALPWPKSSQANPVGAIRRLLVQLHHPRDQKVIHARHLGAGIASQTKKYLEQIGCHRVQEGTSPRAGSGSPDRLTEQPGQACDSAGRGSELGDD